MRGASRGASNEKNSDAPNLTITNYNTASLPRKHLDFF